MQIHTNIGAVEGLVICQGKISYRLEITGFNNRTGCTVTLQVSCKVQGVITVRQCLGFGWLTQFDFLTCSTYQGNTSTFSCTG